MPQQCGAETGIKVPADVPVIHDARANVYAFRETLPDGRIPWPAGMPQPRGPIILRHRADESCCQGVRPKKQTAKAAAAEKAHLIPHSPEWFTALRRQNAVKADMTKATIRAAGRIDVCSVCGDDPAPIYIVQNAPAGLVDTYRLCADCRAIREKNFGETFKAFAH